MRKTELTIPQVAILAGTRGMLGAGLGLLLADRLPQPKRQAAGWTLLLVGLATTVPILFEVFGRSDMPGRARWSDLNRYSRTAVPK
jgi:hypothetical protein